MGKGQHRMGRWRGLGLVIVSMLLWLGVATTAWAESLGDRLQAFPNWETRPPVQAANDDLIYPDWFAGTWAVQTTLVDLAAPLAPELTTPGFDSTRAYLQQPIPFQARFVPQRRPTPAWLPVALPVRSLIVADRAFNGKNLADAYLEDADPNTPNPLMAVKVDPDNPNRQLTLFRGNRQLVSTVTARATETPDANTFRTCEVFQQEFRSPDSYYISQVETTTAYTRLTEAEPDDPDAPQFIADQVTAIYLSPQDPDFFKAGDRPVALYRYALEFRPLPRPE